MVRDREDFLRWVTMKGGVGIYSRVIITNPVWRQYGRALDWLEGFSPYVDVSIGRQSDRQAYSSTADCWGCGWIYPLEALDGQCVGHPIRSWPDLSAYSPPSPDAYADWGQARAAVEQSRLEGRVAVGGTDHGFVFLRMTYLRGFENLMCDMAEGRPELFELAGMIEDYWLGVARRWAELGVDVIEFGDDLGLQHGLPISPEMWRRYIKPSYRRVFSYCRSQGVHVYLHTDGWIVDIIPDLIECGVSVLNPQDFVNGLDNLRRVARGKVSLELDIDRQSVTVFGTPEDIDSHILNCVETLGGPEGGLSFIWGVYPGTPLANIEAVVRALGRYAEGRFNLRKAL